MGFTVTVRKNGVKHGQTHYPSEAVAVGMAKKMRNAGADVSVARCNGACCAKSNPRRRAVGVASDSAFALETKIRETEAMLPAALLRAARQESGWGSGGMMMPTRSEMEAYLRELRRTLKSNPRRNGKKGQDMHGPDHTMPYGAGVSFYSATPKRVMVKRQMADGMMMQPGYEYRGYFLAQGYTNASYKAAESDPSKPLVPKPGSPWTVIHKSGLSLGLSAPTVTGAKNLIASIRATPGGIAAADAEPSKAADYGDEIFGAVKKHPMARNRRRNPVRGTADYYIAAEGSGYGATITPYVREGRGWRPLFVHSRHGENIEGYAKAVEAEYGPVDWTMGLNSATGIAAKSNPHRRNGTTAANIAASRSLAQGLRWNRR